MHDYQLNGNLLDALGGPALVDLGGTVEASGYSFGANEGLKLMDGLADTSDYSIEFLAQYSSLLVDDFEKMVDFQNLTDDQGLYIEDIGADNILRFYDFATGTDAVLAGEDFHVVLTRNGATGDTMGYLDGVLQWMFTDDGIPAAAVPGGNILHFFVDDTVTGQSEAQPGSVDFIRIYDGALTGSEVEILAEGGDLELPPPPSAPEPTTLLLLGLGLAGLGFARKRRH